MSELDYLLDSIRVEIIIPIVLLLQVIVFTATVIKSRTLRSFFRNLNRIKVNEKESSSDVDTIELKGASKELDQVIKVTNNYLRKNKGSAANLEILKDICSRRLDQIVESIESRITLPLYLGLFGTFMGIVLGLLQIEFTDLLGVNAGESAMKVISDKSISALLESVGWAMTVSAMGLAFTVINSALIYKGARDESSKKESDYYDFLQKELLPKLSQDVSESLGTLKDTLDSFNSDFGQNLTDYKESFELLNENLAMEKDFLEMINQLGLNKLSKQIVGTFKDLSDATDDFHAFKKYQKDLNKTLVDSGTIIERYNNVSNQFKNFNENLESVSSEIVKSSEFYGIFKEYLEQHFDTFKERNDKFSDSINQLDNALSDKLGQYNKATEIIIQATNNELSSNKESLNSFVDSISESSEKAIKEMSEATISQLRAKLETIESNKDEFKKSLDDLNKEFKDTLSTFGTNQQDGISEFNNLIEEQHKKYGDLLEKIETELNKRVKDQGLVAIEMREQFNTDWRETMDNLAGDVKDLFTQMNDSIAKETEALLGFINQERDTLAAVIGKNENSFKDLESLPLIYSLLKQDSDITVKYQQNMSSGMENINNVLVGDNGIYQINENLLQIQLQLEELNNNLKSK